MVSEKHRHMADPFWDDSAMMLISSLIAYVKETVPEESGMHNFI